jgi:hypothetical protein
MEHESMARHNPLLVKKMYYHTSVDRKIIQKLVAKLTELLALNHKQDLF